MAVANGKNTVYVRNLEERIKIPELIETLREIFSEYGTIIDLVAKGNLKAKGQAFVVFEDAESAANAIEEIQGFEVFDKPMVLEFAKTPSDATVKRSGEEEFEAHKRQRLEEKERKQAAQQAEKAQREKLKRPDETAQKAAPKKVGLKSTARGGVVPDEFLPPNKTLFVQNIPEEYDVEALTMIFGRYGGFREIRLVPGRKGLAFVEYDTETGAISAKESTQNVQLGSEGKIIKVTYQRQ